MAEIVKRPGRRVLILLYMGWVAMAILSLLALLWIGSWFLDSVQKLPPVVNRGTTPALTTAPRLGTQFSGIIYYGSVANGETASTGKLVVTSPREDHSLEIVTEATVRNGRFTTLTVLDPERAYLLFFQPDAQERERKKEVWNSWPNSIGWPTPHKPGELVDHTVVFPVTLTLSLSY